MPYDPNNIDRSWQLLEEHAKHGDSWVAKARCDQPTDDLEAIICMPRHFAGKSELAPHFKCDLCEHDILILLKNQEKERLNVIFQLEVSGVSHKWDLVLSGKPHKQPVELILEPALKVGWIKRRPSIKPFFMKLDAKRREQIADTDHVTLRAKFATDSSILQAISHEIGTRRTIVTGDHTWIAEVVC
jgi:hypothetical protein